MRESRAFVGTVLCVVLERALKLGKDADKAPPSGIIIIQKKTSYIHHATRTRIQNLQCVHIHMFGGRSVLTSCT